MFKKELNQFTLKTLEGTIETTIIHNPLYLISDNQTNLLTIAHSFVIHMSSNSLLIFLRISILESIEHQLSVTLKELKHRAKFTQDMEQIISQSHQMQ